MKTYSLIAAVTMTLLLNSCSDNDEQTYISPTKMENTKLDEMFDKEGDTIVNIGEPVPPKPKG